MRTQRDTIFALASGSLPSALAIIRLSGPECQSIGQHCLKGGVPAARQSVLRTFTGADGKAVDTGLALYMPGPNSFTGEDTLELTMHGSRIIIDLVFKRLEELGARLAEPGEFTRRAFEEGKLDLTRAEAIADLIEAESISQHEQAQRQLGGALAEQYAAWRAQLIHSLAQLEARIDFPDEDDAPDDIDAELTANIDRLITVFQNVLSSDVAERLREGFHIAILGPPNAGKSTLLNTLAGRDIAIVSDMPGTTRDAIELRMTLGSYLVWFTDTAGLRETENEIEKEGIRRAYKAGEEADIVLWLSETGNNWPGAVTDKDILVRTKIDEVPQSVSRETFAVSAKTGEGITDLLDGILKRLSDKADSRESPFITRARHRKAITGALNCLYQAKANIQQNYPIELVAEDVRLAAQALAGLTGDVHIEEILGEIFSTFCIGK